MQDAVVTAVAADLTARDGTTDAVQKGCHEAVTVSAGPTSSGKDTVESGTIHVNESFHGLRQMVTQMRRAAVLA